VDTYANSSDFAVLYGSDGLLKCLGGSGSAGVAFMCRRYGMEEAAKHPVPEGKFVKVQCVHKSATRIIGSRGVWLASCSSSVWALLPSTWPSITKRWPSNTRRAPSRSILRNERRHAGLRAPRGNEGSEGYLTSAFDQIFLGSTRAAQWLPSLPLLKTCAVERRDHPVGDRPTRQLSLQPVAIGAVVEVTKRLVT
jgi:hypothetical protein